MTNKKESNIGSVISLVLGIISITMFIFSMFDNLIGIFVSIMGITSGIISIVLGAKGKKKENKGMARAGFIMGIIGVSLCGFSFLGCTASFDTKNYDDTTYKEEMNEEENDQDLETDLEKTYLNLLDTYK